MRSVHAACAEVVAQLKAAGFDSVSTEPQDVNPPSAIWVQPRTIGDLLRDRSSGTLTVFLWLVAPNVDVEQAMALLDDGLAGLLELPLRLSPSTDPPIEIGTPLLLPNNATPLPAYRVAVDIDL